MLSIIIPTLNEEEHLPRLLASLNVQTYADFEIIVADAGSTDKTLQVAKSYNATIVPGGLPAQGRNAGAKVARGDILLFLDADVILPPKFLEKTVAEFRRKKLGIAGFAIYPLQGNLLDRLLYALMRLVEHAIPWSAVAIMSAKAVHDKVGGFHEAITLCEDVYYALQTARVSKYSYIGQPFFTSTRRYHKDGRITYIKYLFAFLYTFFVGPVTSSIFNYRFNHYKDKT